MRLYPPKMRRKPGRPRIKLPMEEVIKAYEREGSIRKVATEFGVTYQTVRVRLLRWGVKLRPMGNPISARVGNRGGSNPDAESNPGVSESPPSSIDARHRQILELEAKIVAGDLNLKRAYERKKAAEKELAILKGVPARFSR